jgi:hypothetical protein
MILNQKKNEMLSEIKTDHTANIRIDKDNHIYDRNISSEYYSYCLIYNTLNHAKVPLYMYDIIIQVILDEVRSKRLNPDSKFITRHAMFKWMEKSFPVPKPTKITIPLETPTNKKDVDNTQNSYNSYKDRNKAEIICFDFKEQLVDLLNDYDLFSNIDNLVVNKDPTNTSVKWLPYNGRQDGCIFETLDANWYQNYAKKI